MTPKLLALRMSALKSLCVSLLYLALGHAQVIQLETYNIETDGITVSGISAGAAMATQLHVIYSGTIVGCGLFAGVPYYCAQDRLAEALGPCMENSEEIIVSELTQAAEDYAAQGLADPTENLEGDPVYYFHGAVDGVVDPGNGPKHEEFYTYFGAQFFSVYECQAGHTQPTVDYGNPCTEERSPWIGSCDYDGAYTALKTVYGTLDPPAETISPTSIFAEYDQEEFWDFLDGALQNPSMDSTGYIFIPTICQDKQTPCKLHMVLHGCLQGKQELDDEFALNTGYIEAAEANDIILLFPQAVSSSGNLNGCFDWWGYTTADYANNEGWQPQILIGMIDRVAGTSR